MIIGVVNTHREAVISLKVRGPQGREEELEAVVDTGFNGWLSLPPALIAMLGLPFRRRGRAQLADGSDSLFDIYEGAVMWDGQLRRTAIDEADTDPLVGMSLMYGYDLGMQIEVGGSVILNQRLQQKPMA